MKNDYTENKEKLAERLKNVPAKIAIQEVRPIVQKEKNQKSHVNFWIPNDLMERLKIEGAKKKMTIKQIGIEAFNLYLQRKE
jgi:predicted ferric reductase